MSKKHYKELIGAFRVVIDELKSIKTQMTYMQAIQGTNACKDCILRNGIVETPKVTWTSTVEGKDAK